MTRTDCRDGRPEKMASNEKNTDNNCEVFDNWEDLDETDVLERKLKEIMPSTNMMINDDVEEKSCNKSPVKVILIGDDALRSQYVPPQPTVKILKRPSKESQCTNGDLKPRQQFKSLKQREQEYAQARLRILGEAHSSEKEERILGIQNKNSTMLLRPSDQDNIIRLPRGPDGTRGFTTRR